MQIHQKVQIPIVLHSVIGPDDIVMGRQPLLRQYPPLHKHLIVHVGMLSLGQFLTRLLLDDFEGEFLVGGFVLTDDDGGEVSFAQGAVGIGRFGGAGEFSDGGGARFESDGADAGRSGVAGVDGLGVGGACVVGFGLFVFASGGDG